MMASWTGRQLFAFWFIVGCLAAALLQIGQARAMGGSPEGLLFLGDRQEVAPLVVDELPNAPVTEGFGHDGQIFYAVALDLGGEWVPDTLLSASYRYRRILYPALSSGLGLLDGQALLWGMILFAALPVGVATGTAAMLGRDGGVSPMVALGVVLNPGVWLSTRLLTADNLALALGLLGVYAFTRRRDWLAVVALAAASLAKEPSLVFAAALAGYSWFQGHRKRAVVLSIATVPTLLWFGYVHFSVGSVLDAGGNMSLPGFGIADAAGVWAEQRIRDNVWIALTLAAMIVGAVAAVRMRTMWAWLVATWIVVGLVASSLVWNVGNNVIRALSPLIAMAPILVATWRLELERSAEPSAATVSR